MECLHPKKKIKRILWKRSKEKSNGEDSAGNGTSLMKMEHNVTKRHHSDSMTSGVDRPCMMSLLPLPNLEYCNSGGPAILTGTACKGVAGPPVGVVDIGVSISAYYFRIALPGVKKDPGLLLYLLLCCLSVICLNVLICFKVLVSRDLGYNLCGSDITELILPSCYCRRT